MKWIEEGPIFLCLKRDFEANRFIPFKLFNRDVVAFLDGNKEVAITDNRCSHRGFRVVTKPDNAPPKCRYHGIPLDLTRTWGAREAGEFVFFGTDLANPSYYEPYEMISEDLGEEVFSKEMQVNAPFHLWVQNTMDPNHLPTVHAGGFARNFAEGAKPEDVGFSDDNRASTYKIRIEPSVAQAWQRFLKRPIEPYFRHWVAFPHLSVTSFMGVFYTVETATPATDGESCVVKTRLFLGKQASLFGSLLNLAIESTERILQEDRVIVEAWASSYWELSEFYLPGEERIEVYQALIAEDGL